jgi:hypothetical protein
MKYMMWMMNNKSKDTVKDALVYFERKYGKPPSVIICNPEVKITSDVPVETRLFVLANLLWIGEIKDETDISLDMEASKV